jgi:hypothetical protein
MAEEKSIAVSRPVTRGANWRAPAGIAAGFLLLHLFFLSPAPFWIDASAYSHAIEHGRKVIQPPGYLVFIEIIRILSASFGHPYRIQQILTLAATVASIFVLHRTLAISTNESRATGFTSAFAFSWLALNLGSAGTTHAMDFLFSTFWIWLLVRRGNGAADGRWHLAFFLVLAAAGSIRLTSAIMAGPLFVLLLLRDWRSGSFWFAALFAGAILLVVQILTIHAYGGMPEFRAASAGSHAVISPSSILFGGPWPNVAVNWFRAALWCLLICPILFIPLCRKWNSRPWRGDRPWVVFGCLAMIAGTAFVAFGYLCTHPGYLTPLHAPMLFLAAMLPSSDKLFRRIVVGQIVFSLVLFFSVKPMDGLGSKWMAAANAYLLQYGAHNHRHALPIYSLSGWLALTGNTADIPDERKEDALGELDASGKSRPETDPP